jgi:DNA-binding transcriptional regulator YdaS (Cro superfamily)
MELKDFILGMENAQRQKLAASLAMGMPRLWDMANYHEPIDVITACRIERETAGEVTLKDMRPDYFEALKKAGYTKEK